MFLASRALGDTRYQAISRRIKKPTTRLRSWKTHSQRRPIWHMDGQILDGGASHDRRHVSQRLFLLGWCRILEVGMWNWALDQCANKLKSCFSSHSRIKGLPNWPDSNKIRQLYGGNYTQGDEIILGSAMLLKVTGSSGGKTKTKGEITNTTINYLHREHLTSREVFLGEPR